MSQDFLNKYLGGKNNEITGKNYFKERSRNSV